MRNHQIDIRKEKLEEWTRFHDFEETLISIDEQLADHGLEIVWGFAKGNESVFVKVGPRQETLL